MKADEAKANAAYQREWHAKHPGWRAAYERRWKLEQITKRFGVIKPKMTHCGICGSRIEGSQIALDHNHVTEKFRGWLCSRCNRSLGWFEAHRRQIEKWVRR